LATDITFDLAASIASLNERRHWGNDFVFTNTGAGWEFTAFLAVAALALFLHGDDGRLSLGAILRDRRSVPAASQGVRPAA
jgi:hypothetical protein